jgi:hypothetical protein
LLIRKILIIGIILLFLGVGIQPVIAQPDFTDFIPDNIDKEELTAKINEIMQEYGIKPTEPAFIIITSIMIYFLWLGFNIFMIIVLTIWALMVGGPWDKV